MRERREYSFEEKQDSSPYFSNIVRNITVLGLQDKMWTKETDGG